MVRMNDETTRLLKWKEIAAKKSCQEILALLTTVLGCLNHMDIDGNPQKAEDLRLMGLRAAGRYNDLLFELVEHLRRES
jgi:hypothetical protein